MTHTHSLIMPNRWYGYDLHAKPQRTSSTSLHSKLTPSIRKTVWDFNRKLLCSVEHKRLLH